VHESGQMESLTRASKGQAVVMCCVLRASLVRLCCSVLCVSRGMVWTWRME